MQQGMRQARRLREPGQGLWILFCQRHKAGLESPEGGAGPHTQAPDALKKTEDSIHALETRDSEIDGLLSQEEVYTDVDS